jgi:transcriptional regulator with XRE-family HTH domain
VGVALLKDMPRRDAPDSLSFAVGQRIKDLRLEGGMTIEQLAEESRTGSKGHLSNIERGLVRPNIQTLKQVADGLGVEPLDLMTFPKRSARERLIDLTRNLAPSRLRQLLRDVLAFLRSRGSRR